MKEVIKKCLVIVMSIVILTQTALAGTSSVKITYYDKAVNLKGYKTYNNYKANTYMKGRLSVVNNCKDKFLGVTGGNYEGKTKADTITHYDYITASGIGSLNVSCSGVSADTDSSVRYFDYQVSNAKKISNDVTYYISKGIVLWSATVECETIYKWGTHTSRVYSGDAV